MGHGGRRIGAGRKPKNKTAKLLQHPSAPAITGAAGPIEPFGPPDHLSAEELATWLTQAPHALANRTLTRATALAFERYCKVVVLEQNEAKSSARGGANHRGLLKQVNSYELQFMLAPVGKAMPLTDVRPAGMSADDPDDAFFGGPGVSDR
jgi:hypothetical protein